MEVKRVVPSGFCKGVINAIRLAKNTRTENPNEKIYILGQIVHNRHVTEELNGLGIITLDDSKKSKSEWIDEISEGIVIFTAHGISDAIKAKAISKGLKVVDASCEDVLKNKKLIEDAISQGYDIIYLGKKKHPEAEAALSISPKVHLITNEKDLDETPIANRKLLLTNQTTMSMLELKEIIEKIKVRYPFIEIKEEICQATSSRQMAIFNLKDAELLYVVGDTMSNNTNMLKQIGEKTGIKKVRLISDFKMIDPKDLKGVSKVYVTAGASTPTNDIEKVMEHLRSFKETL